MDEITLMLTSEKREDGGQPMPKEKVKPPPTPPKPPVLPKKPPKNTSSK